MTTKLTSIVLGTAALLLGAGAAGAGTLTSGSASPSANVLFAFDSARLEAGTSDSLREVVDFAKLHPNMKIVLDGHTDEIGATTYNVKLSLRRAESVRDRLAMMGVDGNQIVMGVYGEDGAKTDTYAGDRRVSVWVTDKPIKQIVDQTLAPATAVVWTKPVSETALLDKKPSSQRTIIR